MVVLSGLRELFGVPFSSITIIHARMHVVRVQAKGDKAPISNWRRGEDRERRRSTLAKKIKKGSKPFFLLAFKKLDFQTHALLRLRLPDGGDGAHGAGGGGEGCGHCVEEEGRGETRKKGERVKRVNAFFHTSIFFRFFIRLLEHQKFSFFFFSFPFLLPPSLLPQNPHGRAHARLGAELAPRAEAAEPRQRRRERARLRRKRRRKSGGRKRGAIDSDDIAVDAGTFLREEVRTINSCEREGGFRKAPSGLGPATERAWRAREESSKEMLQRREQPSNSNKSRTLSLPSSSSSSSPLTHPPPPPPPPHTQKQRQPPHRGLRRRVVVVLRRLGPALRRRVAPLGWPPVLPPRQQRAAAPPPPRLCAREQQEEAAAREERRRRRRRLLLPRLDLLSGSSSRGREHAAAVSRRRGGRSDD